MPNLLEQLRENHLHISDDLPEDDEALIDEIGLPTGADDGERDMIRQEHNVMVNTIKLLNLRVENAKALSDQPMLHTAEGQRVVLARRVVEMRRTWPWLID